MSSVQRYLLRSTMNSPCPTIICNLLVVRLEALPFQDPTIQYPLALLMNYSDSAVYVPVKGWQKRATLGAFSGPPSTAPTRQACRVSLSLHGRPWLTFLTHSPSSPERLILAPRALSPKWISLDLLYGSWLAAYMGPCPQQVFVLASLDVVRQW
jgi:hypothetical protein